MKTKIDNKNNKNNLLNRICFNCSHGDFPDPKGACRIDISYYCSFHKKGVSRYDPACGEYKIRKN